MEHIVPALGDSGCIGVVQTQLFYDLRVGQQVGAEYQICVHGVAAAFRTGIRGGTAAAAGRCGKRVYACRCGTRRRRNRLLICTGDIEGPGERLEAVRVDGQRILSAVRQMVGSIVIQHEGIADEIPVVKLIEHLYLGIARILQFYAVNRLGDAVQHILHRKMRVHAAVCAGIAQHQRRRFLVYHMDREQLGIVVRYHAQLVATVREEVRLTERDNDARNGSAVNTVRELLVEFPIQIVIEHAVAFIVLHEHNVRNAVHKRLFRVGTVGIVEHKLYLTGNMIEIIVGFA